jgi:lipoprotein-anchoring transpeptidase ErfK/SrfK
VLCATPSAANPYEPGGSPIGRFFGSFGAPGGRSTVVFPGNQPPGTIVISTSQRRLYYVLGNGQALQYAIGVGRDGFAWSGVTRVSSKREWPSWSPPAAMRQRRPDLPRHMAGGPDNPLGARAIYLGSTLYRIHGSNEPETIGQAVSSGCFRMTNEDVIDLYSRVRVGSRVVVQQ